MSQADTPLVVQKYPVLHQVYEALGLATLYTHHAGDFRAALQIVEAECSICDAKDEARLAAALTGRGIVRTLQGNCVGALADLRAATTMEHSDLPLKLLACLYWYQATRTQYALFPDNGPAGAKEIQYRFDAVQTLQDWQAQTSPLSEAYSTDPPLRVVDQALRLYRSLTSFPRANPGADSTFRTAQDTLLSGIDTDYDTLAIWRPDPRMLGHMRLLRARTALRIHGREEAMQDLAIAEQLAREVDDSVGLADVELTRGDFLAAPLSSPGVWNSLLAESTYDTCLHWQADEAEWDVDTERIGEAKARYDAALTRFAAANARRGIAAVKMRLGCLEVLEGMRRVVFEPSFAAAKTDIERAVAISSELGDMMAVQLGRAQLALCAIGQGDQSEHTQQVGVSLGTWGRREGSFGFTLGVGLFFARIGWRWINHLGDYERALACFRLAETLFQALQASLSRVHSIVDQLKVYQMVGDFPSCTRTLERALDECLEVQKREPGLVAEVSRLARWISIEMLGLATKRAVPHLIERVRAYIKNIRKTHESADPAGLSAGLDIFQERLNRLQAGEDLADSSSEPSVGHALYQQDATQMTDLFLESQLADSEIYQDLYSGKEAKKNGHPAEAHVCFDRVRVVAESMSGYRRHYFYALADAYEGEYQRAAPAYTQYVDGELEEMDRMAPLDFPPSLDDDRRRQAASRALSFFCEIGHFEEAHKWLHLLSQNWPDWWKKDGQSWLSLGRIAQVEEGLGHFEAALLQYEEGIRMFEAQRQRLSIDELKIAFAADSPTSALFVGCIRTLLTLQDQPNIEASRRRELQAKIFDVAERNKARSLMDLMEGGLVGRLSSSESGPLPRWRRLNAKRTSRCGLLEQALHSSDPERPRIAALQAEITAIEQQIAAVENDMAATGSPLRTWAAELSTLDAVCETLPVGVLVLVYIYDREDLFSWAISSQGVMGLHHKSLEIYWLDRATKRFHEACQSMLRPGNLGQVLSDELLEPFREFLGRSRRVVIVPHGSLHFVPFHALPFMKGDPLSSSHVVTYVPSVSLLRYLDSGQARGRSPSVLALGNPCNMSFQDMYGRHHRADPLPGTEQEVSRIAQILPNTKCFIGAEANISNFRTHSSDHSILHLATHCRVVADVPLLSSISLANKHELSVLELVDLHLDVDLVVLSACQTGQGALTAGNDVVGFSRALLAAGARAVLVSLWPVDDEATCELISHFYQGVSEGQSFPDALRNAQEKLRHDVPLPKPESSDSCGARIGEERGRMPRPRRLALHRDVQPLENTQPLDNSSPAYWAPFMLICGLKQHEECGKKFYQDLEGLSDAKAHKLTHSLSSNAKSSPTKSEQSPGTPTSTGSILDQGVLAFLVEQSLPGWPVKAPPVLGGLQEAIQKSRFLALHDREPLLEFQHDHGQVTIRMWDGIQIAAQQLPDDVSSAAAFTTIVRAAEHLARAQHLLALQSGKDDEALRQNVETEIGIVYQGDRGRIIPQNGSGTLVEHDRIYIRLTNRGTSTVYVTVFGINKAGIIGLLSEDDATGIKLEPDQSYTLGGGGEFEALKGMGVTWPKGVPSSQPVDEQIVLILTDPAVDLRHLANRDRCQKGRRGPQSNLEQLANCITYGGTRTIKPEPRATPIRYDVLQVPYSLLPFTQQDPGPNADYAIREWSREEPMAANEIPEPEADASWRALPSQPSVVPRASKGGIGALVRAAKGIPPCVWVVNQHSEEITVVVSKYRPSRLVSGGGISASSTGAGVNISTMTFLSPVTKKKLAPSALGPTRSKAVFPLWTRKEGFGVISILKGPSESLYIENDRIPIGATAYFKNLPDLELRDYYGQQLN